MKREYTRACTCLLRVLRENSSHRIPLRGRLTYNEHVKMAFTALSTARASEASCKEATEVDLTCRTLSRQGQRYLTPRAFLRELCGLEGAQRLGVR